MSWKIVKTVVIVSSLIVMVCGPASATDAPVDQVIDWQDYVFTARDGTSIEAERGRFMVPENRTNPESRMIALQFVRFKSTADNPGAPIIYLAGGPGGSGVRTAEGRRFPLFMAMREFGDVIAFDQRGTGWSNPIPPCQTDRQLPLADPITRDRSFAIIRAAADECQAFWIEQGVDLSGYNTLESARDLDVLRNALGAEKIDLWGISYGSHLAHAALKTMPDKIGRLVLAGVEGLDETVKLPMHTDRYFDRLQAAIEQSTKAGEAVSDITGRMRRVFDRLDAQPITVQVKDRNDQFVDMTIGKMDMQLLASFMISDPRRAVQLVQIIQLAEAGDFEIAARLIFQNLRGDPIAFRGMPEAMDIMSGIPPIRLERVREQAQTALLGDMLNYPMPHLMEAFDLKPLGETFWTPVRTNVPVLYFVSTLDGRTYPEGAARTMAGFSNARRVIVEHGGHNVFMQDPAISAIIVDFMRGNDVPESVTVPLP